MLSLYTIHSTDSNSNNLKIRYLMRKLHYSTLWYVVLELRHRFGLLIFGQFSLPGHSVPVYQLARCKRLRPF